MINRKKTQRVYREEGLAVRGDAAADVPSEPERKLRCLPCRTSAQASTCP
jgi:hypothetical protein